MRENRKGGNQDMEFDIKIEIERQSRYKERH